MAESTTEHTEWEASALDTGTDALADVAVRTDAVERPMFRVKTPVGGWPYPWPNVEELARELPPDRWTLIGGLMTQMHAIHRGVNAVRPTNDVDIVLHIETARGTPNVAATVLESLGYRIQESIDPRSNFAHRFTRGETHVDVVSSSADEDVVDVVVADHAAPSVEEQMRRKDMVRVAGGTQALRRTANYELEIVAGELTTISVPRPYGAVILKAAAYLADSRDPGRHLQDAAVLLACIEDPFDELEQIAGSDGKRLGILSRELVEAHPAWLLMPEADARRGQATLRVLNPPA